MIDPVVDEYERFEGSVTSIKCSPLSNIFVSTGTNMEIRIFDVDKVKKLYINHYNIHLNNFIYFRKAYSESLQLNTLLLDYDGSRQINMSFQLMVLIRLLDFTTLKMD